MGHQGLQLGVLLVVNVQACCVERRPQVLPVLTETLRGTSGSTVGCIVGGRRSGLLCRKASPSLACADRDPERDKVYSWMYCWW